MRRYYVFITILSLLVFVSLPVYAIALLNNSSENRQALSTSEFLIKFKNTEAKELWNNLGLIEEVNLEPKDNNLELEKWAEISIETYQKLKSIKANPLVDSIYPSIQYSIGLVPNDPLYESQNSIINGEYDQWNLRSVGLNPVETPSSGNSGWEVHTGSSDTIIAVVDTGIDLTHPDLASNLWINSVEQSGLAGIDDDNNGYIDDVYGYNFYDNNSNVQDVVGHGTSVSGVIAAATSNNVGISGICWSCKIMTVRTFGTDNFTGDSIIAEGIVYAVDNGAKIINLSLGGFGYSGLLQDAINYADANNVFVVAASGNNADDSTLYSPAGLENVITVNAINYQNNLSSFSNFGTRTDLAAPGEMVLTTRLQTLGNGCLGSQLYHCVGGTSFSAPHVSGAIALKYDLHKNDLIPWTNLEIRKALLNSATDLGTVGFDESFGFGKLNVLSFLESSVPILGTDTPTTAISTPSGSVFNNVEIIGSVTSNNLYAYYLKFILIPNIPIYIFTGRNQVNNGVLFDLNLIFPEGEYIVELTAEDYNGNKSSISTINMTIDNTIPSSFNLLAPTNSWSTNTLPNFSWQSSVDTNGPLSYAVVLNTNAIAEGLTQTFYQSVSPISEGIYNWRVDASDRAGNVRQSASAQLRIDTTQPASFSINRTVQNKNVTFTFTTTDSLSGISNYQFSLNNGSFTTVSSPYTLANLSDGNYSARIRAFDMAGNFRESNTTFTISRSTFLKTKGDVNGDAIVDLSDLSILATYWNQNNSISDINSDGIVDISDLSILAINWRQSF